MTLVRESIDLGGITLEFEMGKVARQADGAVVVSCGDTKVLVTAVMQREPKEASFLPLTVDYREWTYAGGRIPGGFFKREGRPTEKEILTSRMIDRSIRPLFPAGYRHETQVIGMVMSADGENDPGVLAKVGASFALYLSKIPFDTPFGAFRVGLVDGEYVLNPTTSQLCRRASSSGSRRWRARGSRRRSGSTTRSSAGTRSRRSSATWSQSWPTTRSWRPTLARRSRS